jgi:hypothetical protein
VLAHERGEALVHLGTELVAGDGPELVLRRLDPELDLAAVAEIDDRAHGRAVGSAAASADEQPRHLPDGLLRRREPDALQRAIRERVEPLERQRQVRAALVAGDGVDLVHDHRARQRQRAPAPLRGQQDVERLRRRYQDVGRPPHHLLPLPGRRVAGARRDADLGERCSTLLR